METRYTNTHLDYEDRACSSPFVENYITVVISRDFREGNRVLRDIWQKLKRRPRPAEDHTGSDRHNRNKSCAELEWAQLPGNWAVDRSNPAFVCAVHEHIVANRCSNLAHFWAIPRALSGAWRVVDQIDGYEEILVDWRHFMITSVDDYKNSTYYASVALRHFLPDSLARLICVYAFGRHSHFLRNMYATLHQPILLLGPTCSRVPRRRLIAFD